MVITKKSPLSILHHLRVVNLEFLKQRFDGCLFHVSFYVCMYIFVFIYVLGFPNWHIVMKGQFLVG